MNFLGSTMPSILVLCLSCVLVLSEPIVDTDEDADTTEVSFRGERNLKDLITNEVLEEVFKDCEATLKARSELENKLYKKGRVVKSSNRKTDPSLIRMRKSDPVVHYRESLHWTFDEVTRQLYLRFNLTRDEIGQILRTWPLEGELSRKLKATCTEGTAATSQCDDSAKFRTADGSCNNLKNPTWGSAMTCQRRVMPAYYVGNSGYRESVLGGPLPAPRTLSLNLHDHLNRPTNYVTHMYMFFGQLLDHDVALTPGSTTTDNEAIECCPVEEETHPQCRPITPRTDDPFYSQFNITCLNFVRSAVCATCNLGPKEVMDQVTAFIDTSFVYGNSDNETASLRANDGTGRLRTQNSQFGDLLPPSPNPADDQCSFPDSNEICFDSGDSRVNQHTVLTSLQTVFMREHNRLADGLKKINPQWNGDRIFQEARRILSAQMQAITYKEYLPITLGPDRMTYFDLWIGRRTKYDPKVDASLIVEFSTAAFRFGHSLINSVVANSPRNASNERRLLRNDFFQPFDLYRGFTGPLLRGASNSPAQWFDRHMVPDVTNYLYRVRGDRTGLDLASININRGRDHGLPPYVEAVRFCSDGRIVVRDFSDLVRLDYRLMGREQMEALRSNYRSVEDIDLWPGILMETPNAGAVVGPTAACLIGEQFRAWKKGDRFYFENYNTPTRFSFQQLAELRKITLSKIICLNTDVSQIALNAMLFNSINNPVISCRLARGVDLSYWRERSRSGK